MASLIEELKTYLRETPMEQKLRDWEEIVSMGDCGPGVFDYLDQLSWKVPEIEISNKNVSPEFSLDFSFFNNRHYGTSKILTR